MIYHSKSLGIAVAFEGTNTSSLLSDANDVLFWHDLPNSRYSEYMPNGIRLMHGFQEAYIKLVDDVMPAIKKYKSQYNESRVTVIGHSLGAAIGLIASMDVHYRIDSGLYKSYLFGLPRVGNHVFADLVDKTIGHKLHWFVSGRDWVPSVPPREFDYQHPSNYVWIYPANSTNWNSTLVRRTCMASLLSAKSGVCLTITRVFTSTLRLVLPWVAARLLSVRTKSALIFSHNC